MPVTIIIGKTCSGKTKIVDKLVSTYKYKKISYKLSFVADFLSNPLESSPF